MARLVGPLDPHALEQARTLFAALPALESGESLVHTYLHWEVEKYGCVDAQYNIVIALLNGAWVAKIATSPRANAIQVGDGAPYAAHTYHRNSHAVGIAVSGMVDATASDFGAAPIQMHELEVLCAANAAVAKRYGIDLNGKIDGEPTCMTHAEAAIVDGYFGERWDLARLVPSGDPLTPDEARANAALLRFRSHEYKLAL